MVIAPARNLFKGAVAKKGAFVMESLEERLQQRKEDYERIVEAERLIQGYFDKLAEILPESANFHATIYNSQTFIYVFFPSVEDFEEEYITPLSETFNVVWRRSVNNSEVRHEADMVIEEEDYTIYLIVQSKPTDSCRIIKVPTGKVRTTYKSVPVEEAEYEYLVECSDD